MTDAADPRAALRAELRARRDALSAGERILASQSLVASLEQAPRFLTDRRVAGYWAVAGELPLAALIQGLRQRDQVYHLPIVGADRQLKFGPWRPGGDITMNRYGIPEPVCASSDLLEPAQMDVVLVPLLGFDQRGHRLGFGGGYYDRSFDFLRDRRAPGSPLLVGIAYAMQEVAQIDAMPWDVRLDHIATERALIDCAP
ncbi:MAG: 5-formyltetrahydrofolate cyclo-ligase [Dokdonella sp.]|uniref:5-formyltetrahydrofolate cyclo-ligase n=1 Tax=Dokdonella sp. TaxID=2291710 RepID=UPI003263F7B3